jgi:UDP-GlcNAc:undecaprenyl-phosphate/decaprenyl-phosphate GlcNAc-1-phosphate transferase
MLGDAGANALGALLGAAVAAGLPRSARLAVLAGVVGLTAASEKVSFTKVIARTPALNKLDMLGRRPPAPAAPPAPAPAGPSGAEPSGAEPSGAGPSAAEAAAVANAETGPIPVVDPARPTAVP